MASRAVKIIVDGHDLVVQFNYTTDDGYDIKRIDYRGVSICWVLAYAKELEDKIIEELDKIMEQVRKDDELDAAIPL
jgi:hypothetical protein